MIRDDDSVFLLYMEPKKEEKSKEPIDDEMTSTMIFALNRAESGIANYSKANEDAKFESQNGWRGFHITDCGEWSENYDFQLENGMITNSLAPFYLRWYRNSISKNDMKKMEKLMEFYKNKK